MEPLSGVVKSNYFVRFFDLARGIQSPLSLPQPLLGAVIALRALPGPRVLILGLIAATAGYFAVFSLNDILDHKTDRESIGIGKAKRDAHDIGVTVFKHPLAHGDISLVVAITWVAFLMLISGTFAYILNPLCLWLFVGCIALETAYCSMRTVSWIKTFPTGIMVAMGGLAGWAAVAPLNIGAVGFFLFIALWEIAGRNLANDLADAESDRGVGIRTVATTFGNRTSATAIFISAWMTVASAMFLPISLAARLATLGVTLWAMGVPSIMLLRIPTSEQASIYFNRASFFPLVVLVTLVPFLALRSL